MLAFILLLVVSLALLAALAWTEHEARQILRSNWQDLSNSFYPVKIEEVIALTAVNVSKRLRNKIIVEDWFERIGGQEGVERMEHNMRVMKQITRSADIMSGTKLSNSSKAISHHSHSLKVYSVLYRASAPFASVSYFSFSCLRHIALSYSVSVEEVLALHRSVSIMRYSRLIAAINWTQSGAHDYPE